MAEQGKRHRRLRVMRVLLLAGLLGVMYLVALVVRIELAGQHDERGPADVIIVLGAAQYDGRPSPVYQARLDHAIGLYRAGYAPYLLFTGGQRPGDRFTEAGAGRLYALRQGVPAEHTLTEDAGRTTMQSMQAAAEIMRKHGFRGAILVSDPFHVFRLKRMARDLGIQARVSPAEHSRVRSPAIKARYIAREVATYAIYRLLGL